VSIAALGCEGRRSTSCPLRLLAAPAIDAAVPPSPPPPLPVASVLVRLSCLPREGMRARPPARRAEVWRAAVVGERVPVGADAVRSVLSEVEVALAESS